MSSTSSGSSQLTGVFYLYSQRAQKTVSNDDPYKNPNPKYTVDGTVPVFNRIPICKTYFEL